MCPWIDPLISSSSLLNHSVPVLFFSGQIDAVAPPNLHAEAQYNHTPLSTIKLLYEVFLGGHSIANSPSGGQGEVGRMALSWLKTHLEQDSCYCPLLLNVPTTSSDYKTNLDCSYLTSTDVVKNSSFFHTASYNGFVLLEKKLINKPYLLFDFSGRVVLKGVSANSLLDVSKIKKGVYFLSINEKTIKVIRF